MFEEGVLYSFPLLLQIIIMKKHLLTIVILFTITLSLSAQRIFDFEKYMNYNVIILDQAYQRNNLKKFVVNDYYCTDYTSSVTCDIQFVNGSLFEAKFFKISDTYSLVLFNRYGIPRYNIYYDHSNMIEYNTTSFLRKVIEFDELHNYKYNGRRFYTEY